jgi:hypothetical protein
MNIDDLTGRPLDAAVAERLFGLLVEERANARTGKKDFVAIVRPDAPTREWVQVAYYSVSMAASITVSVELQNRGWKRKESQVGGEWNEPSEERVVLEHTDGRTVEAFGPVNVALCRAALKAVGAGE